MNDDHRDTPQGPEDPHGTGGLDAPPPPGGPQRTDQPAPGATPDDPDEPPRSPAYEPRDGADSDEEPAPDGRQAENAGTSLDEPSDSAE